MDRQEIEQTYNVSAHGTIESPGQFEGEMLYAPYFWDMVLDGCGESIFDGDLEISVFDVNDEDLAMFPELGNTDKIALWQNEQGFIFVQEDPDIEAMREEDQISIDPLDHINLADWGIADDLHIDPDRKDEWTDKHY